MEKKSMVPISVTSLWDLILTLFIHNMSSGWTCQRPTSMHQTLSSQPTRTPDGCPNCCQWSQQEIALEPSMVIKATIIPMVTQFWTHLNSQVFNEKKWVVTGQHVPSSVQTRQQCIRHGQKLLQTRLHSHVLRGSTNGINPKPKTCQSQTVTWLSLILWSLPILSNFAT